MQTLILKPRSLCPRLHHDFLNIISNNGLEQLVQEPTRDENTLDLLLTDCPQLSPRIEAVRGLSDHSIPYCEFNVSTQKKKQEPRKIRLYAKADWNSLKEVATDLSFSMQQAKDTATTAELLDMVNTTLTEAVNTHILHKTAKTRYRQPWLTAAVRKLIHKRDKVCKRMEKTDSGELKTEVKTYIALCNNFADRTGNT